MISLEFAILFWIVILVSVFFILRNSHINWYSSLAFSLLISWIILIALYGSVHNENDCDEPVKWLDHITKVDPIILFITAATIIFVLVYMIISVFRNRDFNEVHPRD